MVGGKVAPCWCRVPSVIQNIEREPFYETNARELLLLGYRLRDVSNDRGHLVATQNNLDVSVYIECTVHKTLACMHLKTAEICCRAIFLPLEYLTLRHYDAR